jgi:hypothetical protein
MDAQKQPIKLVKVTRTCSLLTTLKNALIDAFIAIATTMGFLDTRPGQPSRRKIDTNSISLQEYSAVPDLEVVSRKSASSSWMILHEYVDTKERCDEEDDETELLIHK